MLFRGGFYVEWESVQVTEYVEIILENVIVLQVCLHSFFFVFLFTYFTEENKKKQRQVLELRDKPHPIIKQT